MHALYVVHAFLCVPYVVHAFLSMPFIGLHACNLCSSF